MCRANKPRTRHFATAAAELRVLGKAGCGTLRGGGGAGGGEEWGGSARASEGRLGTGRGGMGKWVC